MNPRFPIPEYRSHIFTIDVIRKENEMTHTLIMKENFASQPGL